MGERERVCVKRVCLFEYLELDDPACLAVEGLSYPRESCYIDKWESNVTLIGASPRNLLHNCLSIPSKMQMFISLKEP